MCEVSNAARKLSSCCSYQVRSTKFSKKLSVESSLGAGASIFLVRLFSDTILDGHLTPVSSSESTLKNLSGEIAPPFLVDSTAWRRNLGRSLRPSLQSVGPGHFLPSALFWSIRLSVADAGFMTMEGLNSYFNVN